MCKSLNRPSKDQDSLLVASWLSLCRILLAMAELRIESWWDQCLNGALWRLRRNRWKQKEVEMWRKRKGRRGEKRAAREIGISDREKKWLVLYSTLSGGWILIPHLPNIFSRHIFFPEIIEVDFFCGAQMIRLFNLNLMMPIMTKILKFFARSLLSRGVKSHVPNGLNRP